MTPAEPTASKSSFEVVREIEICARRETVFRYFTDSERFARWWGAGSRVEPRAGGEVYIRHPDGSIAGGRFMEIAEPERVVFSFGYGEGEGAKMIPLGASTVTITFTETPRGTRVTLRHTSIPSAAVAQHHVQGWRYQLSLYAKVATAEQHEQAAAKNDAWFAAWNEPDAAKRRALLAECAAPDVQFFDQYGALAGHDDLDGQIAAVFMYMPGMRIARAGEPLHCQGHGLVRWEVRDPKGELKGKGVNAVTYAPDGKIARVVGFWGA